ncbi:MAG: hypothetical protein AB7O26_12565 [Planctomycetaceae bacterium]
MSARYRKLLIALLCLSIVGTIAFLWGTEIPLGVDGEWVWKRIPVPDDGAFTFFLSGAMTTIFGAVYLVVAWFGQFRIDSAPRAERTFWLAALTAAGIAWLCAVQESPAPLENQWGKAAWVTYFRGSSGYYDEARYVMRDVPSYLAGYEQRMTEGDFLHFGTHPPGLALFHRATIIACENSPPLVRFLLSTQPNSVEEAFRTIEENNRGGSRPLEPLDRAAIWLAVSIIQGVSTATLIPLFFLASRNSTRGAAWKACSLWPAVPSLAVFLPVSDAFYPFFGTLFLAVWLSGWSRRSAVRCVLAGLVLWSGMFLSLALLPVALVAAIVTLAEAWIGTTSADPTAEFKKSLKSTAICVGWSLVGFTIPILLLWLVFHTNLISIWTWNLRNHEGFYDHNTRTYWKWLIANPLELAFGVGWPVIILTCASAVALKSRKRLDVRAIPFAACFGVWSILWLSGKNMGEAARLWLVVMPWPFWLTAGLFDVGGTSHSTRPHPPVIDDSRPMQSVWMVALIAQLTVCAATVARVNGFDFGL